VSELSEWMNIVRRTDMGARDPHGGRLCVLQMN